MSLQCRNFISRNDGGPRPPRRLFRLLPSLALALLLTIACIPESNKGERPPDSPGGTGAADGTGGTDTTDGTDGTDTTDTTPTPGVTVDVSSVVPFSENGGSTSFTVVLDVEPSAGVVVNITSGDEAKALLSDDGGTVTAGVLAAAFTSADWETPRTITVVGVDDAVAADDAVVAIALVVDAAASAAEYAAVDPDDVTVTVENDDAVTATAVTTGGELYGWQLAAGVNDWLSFSGWSGTDYTIAVQDAVLSGSLYLSVMKENGSGGLAFEDSFTVPNGQTAGSLTYTPILNGTYFLKLSTSATVSEIAAAGTDSASFTISITESAAPHGRTDGAEPDDTPATAAALSTDGIAAYRELTADNNDWVKFSATGGTNYQITLDTVITPFAVVVSGWDGTAPTVFHRDTFCVEGTDGSGSAIFTAFTSGDYYLKLSTSGAATDETATGSAEASFNIAVSETATAAVSDCTAVAAAPANLTAAGDFGKVDLAWDAVANATSYNVYWGTASGVTVATGNQITGISTAAYSHNAENGLSGGGTFYYIVTTVNAFGESGSSAEVSSTYTNGWRTMAPMPTARSYPAAAAVDGIIYAIGGYNGGSYLSTVEAYDPAADSWSTMAPMTTVRYAPAAAAVNGIVYVIGGNNGSNLNTVEAYDPAADSWSAITLMPTARHGLAAAVVNGIVYVIGGHDGSYVNTVEAFAP